jgi:hypothetical protein
MRSCAIRWRLERVDERRASIWWCPWEWCERFLIATSLVLAVLCTGQPSSEALAASVDSTQYPQIRSGAWANAPLAAVQNGSRDGVQQGHIGVDMWMGNPNLNGGRDYLPCQNPSETYLSACAMPNAYYKVLHYCSPSSSDFPYGLFVGNVSNGLTTNWGNKTTGVALEIYPYSTDLNTVNGSCNPSNPQWNGYGYDLQPCCGQIVYGGLRIVASNFNYPANGGWYSASIGTVRVPEKGDSDVGMVQGYLCHNGAGGRPRCPNGNNAPDHTVSLDWFGQAWEYNRSTAGYGVNSFASWPNQSANTGQPSRGSGYYTSGPLLLGNTKLYVTDHVSGKGWLCAVNVQGWGQNLSLNLDDAYLGQPKMCQSGFGSRRAATNSR